MICYPLPTLILLAGIKEIFQLFQLLQEFFLVFKDMLGDGSELGITLSYAEQPSPDGLADKPLSSGEAFIGDDNVALILLATQ
ncbi:MAG: hypothetical protein ACLU4Q_05560 [Streptococcus thermophilus]